MSSWYVPDRGHLGWLDFDPQTGHEQAGRRPALILSPAAYNAVASLILCCPITRQAKGYHYEVALPAGLPIADIILADQAKSQDWVARNARFICVVPDDIVDEVRDRISLLMTI